MGRYAKTTIRLNIEQMSIWGLAIGLLLSCSSVYNLASLMIVPAIVLIFSIICLIYAMDKHSVANMFFILLIYGVLALFTDFLVDNTVATYHLKFYVFMFVFIMINCCWQYEKKIRFLRIMEKIIFFMAVVSLILWLMGPIMNIISSTGSYNVRWGRDRTYYSYYGLFFAERIQKKNLFGIFLARNLSIYPEGPFSNLIFSLGFIIYILTYNSRKKMRVLLYLVAIFSTLSTTGWAMAIVVLCTDYIHRTSKVEQKSALNRVFLRFVLPIAVVAASLYSVYSVFAYKEATDSANYLAHISALSYGLGGFLNNPLFGVGIGASGELYSNSTSGLLRILGDGGIMLTSLYIVPAILAFYRSRFGKKNYQVAFFTGYILVMLLLVIWHYSLLLLFFMSMGYSLLIMDVPRDIDNLRR